MSGKVSCLAMSVVSSFPRRLAVTVISLIGALGLSAAIPIAVVSGIEAGKAPIEEVSPNVFLIPDTCNVYLIRCGDRAVAIDCGSAKMLEYLPKIRVNRVDCVFLTHHHRDQCQGAARMLEHGAKIAVPEGENEFLADADEFWRKADIYRRYRFKPDFFVLRRRITRVDDVLKDGDVVEIGPLKIRALATPGHTPVIL